MGRKNPSRGSAPAALRRDARSKRAKATLNKDVPALLRAYPRALKGVESAELIVDPPVVHEEQTVDQNFARETLQDDVNSTTSKHQQANKEQKNRTSVHIRFQIADTLQAAHVLLRQAEAQQPFSGHVALLNMASPLRPGGGFLSGAQAQEETLCMRTTLYPALREEFYRLPELGVVYTRDVLVFRGWDVDFTDLPKHERFFVDVITAAMPRFPDIDAEEGKQPKYANLKDKELVERKMRAVMRILQIKGVKHVVLGAWGCGAYKNPLEEVAALWKKVLLPDARIDSSKRNGKSQGNKERESWNDMEVVFAINDPAMAKRFAEVFELPLEDMRMEDPKEKEDADDQKARASVVEEMQDKIDQMVTQIAQTRHDELRERLETVLKGLRTQMSKMTTHEEVGNVQEEE